MKKTRYTEEQIAFALKQAETGTRVGEVCRKTGISETTFYSTPHCTFSCLPLLAAKTGRCPNLRKSEIPRINDVELRVGRNDTWG